MSSARLLHVAMGATTDSVFKLKPSIQGEEARTFDISVIEQLRMRRRTTRE